MSATRGCANPAKAAWIKSASVIIEQYPIRGSFQVVVLAGPQRPEEDCQRTTAKEQAGAEQVEDDIHTDLPRSLKLFAITSSEELDIAAAASQGVTTPAIASGTISALYPIESARFCRITLRA